MGIQFTGRVNIVMKISGENMRNADWLAVLGLCMVLCGCATGDRYQKSSLAAAEAGVSAAVVQIMAEGKRLAPSDVIALSRAGVSDEVILDYLKRQRAVYLLRDREVAILRESGVTSAVIAHMVATPRKLNSRVYPKGYVPNNVCRPEFVRLIREIGGRGWCAILGSNQ